MAQQVFLIEATPKKEQEALEGKNIIFRGDLEDMLHKYGAKNSNPMVGFTYKRIVYVYRFWVWDLNQANWVKTQDPRPESI